MTSTPFLAMLLFLAVTSWLTLRDPLLQKRWGLRAVGASAWCVAACLAISRTLLTGDDLALSMWAATLIYVVAIVATLGRPALLMDQLLEDDPEIAISRSEKRRGLLGQVAVLIAIVCWAAFSSF